MDADALIREYELENIPRVKLAFVDIDGVLRGKYISLDKFRSIAGGTSCLLYTSPSPRDS